MGYRFCACGGALVTEPDTVDSGAPTSLYAIARSGHLTDIHRGLARTCCNAGAVYTAPDRICRTCAFNLVDGTLPNTFKMVCFTVHHAAVWAKGCVTTLQLGTTV
jgi:hypothetical protein